jgi:hypothetical protein
MRRSPEGRPGGTDAAGTGYHHRMADPKTEELRLEQIHRERSERDQAGESFEPAEQRTHRRRADRAAYLKSKLDERARSEEDDQ